MKVRVVLEPATLPHVPQLATSPKSLSLQLDLNTSLDDWAAQLLSDPARSAENPAWARWTVRAVSN